MEKRYFEYSHNPEKGKYTEITEEDYLKAKATGKRFFICLDGVFLECEWEEYHAYFVEMNHSYNSRRDKKGRRIRPKSYDELSDSSNFESMIVTDPTLPTIEQMVEERLCSEWEIAALHKAMDLLKPYERELIHKIYWDGMSQSDLAREYHISQQTMNEKINRILCKLLNLMKS